MLGQRLAGIRSETGDDVEDAFRHTSFSANARQFDHGDRREFGRLDDERITGSKRGRDLFHRDQQRMIPGRQLSNDAERQAPHVIEVRAGEGRHAAFRRLDQRAKVLQPFRHAPNLRLHLADRATGGNGFNFRQFVRRVQQALRRAIQNARALPRLHPRPASISECLFANRDRPIDVFGFAFGDHRGGFTLRRVLDGEITAALCRDGSTVNKHIVPIFHARAPPLRFIRDRRVESRFAIGSRSRRHRRDSQTTIAL